MSTDNITEDVTFTAGAYDTTEGRVYTVTGGDWDTISAAPEGEKERIVVNMGP